MNIIDIMKKFATQKDCIEYLEEIRWYGKPICPYCGSTNTNDLPKQLRHHCNGCRKSFSVTIGTIFHDTRLPLQKWFLAINLILNAKKGISSCQLARDIQVHQETAWSMGHRIRKAMQQKDGELLKGIVEMDETYVGGKPRKETKNDDDKEDQNKRGRGTKKQAVIGMIERKGNVKAQLASNNKLTFKILSELVRKNIDTKQAILCTDEFKAYARMKTIIVHKQIDHRSCMWSLNGISTNYMESFWAIVKRGIIGQFHKVSKKYLNKYLDEFCWRFNNKDNGSVFDSLIGNMVLLGT
jgi:transposase-like protein